MRAIAMALLLWLAACVPADDLATDESTEALKFPPGTYVGTTANLGLHLVVSIAGPKCPTGWTQYSLDFEVCQDPVRYSCTAVYCTDGAGHTQLATPQPLQSNPTCSPSVTNPECSSNPSMRERFVPTREDLVERAPNIIPRELLGVPLK